MRIIAGAWRGRPLLAPPGLGTRPTSDRAREGLFSMLASRIGTFEGLRVADLFAGSGALGLEALSRGATYCLFVDGDRNAVTTIERNLASLGAAQFAEVRHQRVEHLAAPATPFDLLFLDPPYESGIGEETLAQLCSSSWLAPGGWISLETGGPPPALPDGMAIGAERRFGRATLYLLTRAR
ncbi:MAG: 16S rRNA (guanine(966)-N(2))-methyltransferase RsmD [Sphingomonadales bacterium]